MTATYRLQLHAELTFAHARKIVPYLAELGITHLYLSPIMQAAEGSTHGYDVVDANRVSEQLGGEAGFAALVADVRAHGLQILLDIVPNHMSIAGTQNAWWMDVLENGPASYFAHFFDVDWSAENNRVTLPVLEERYGRALANGSLAVVYDEQGFSIRAGDARYPIAPESLAGIVRRAGDRTKLPELGFIGDALAALPHDTSTEARRRRHRDKAVLSRRLSEMGAMQALTDEVAAVNADKVELDALLEAQAYRLVHWSVSTSELGYRRFFDVNTLVGLRVEDLDVFEARHERVLQWLRDGTIAGVRIDHVDGLRDPGAYLARLRERAPDAWIVVEKIRASDEAMPPWPIDGTTGYEFAERIGSLVVDPAGEQPLTHLFEEFTGHAFDAAAGRRAARREVMSDALHSELSRLVELATRACAQSAATRDYTRTEITHALTEIIAGYPVYRTYLTGERTVVVPPPVPTTTTEAFAVTGLHVVASAASGDQQLAVLPRFSTEIHVVSVTEPSPRAHGTGPLPLIQLERDRAKIAHAARAVIDADPDLLAFLELALAGEVAQARELSIAAQQVTGAIVAKGDEDTASYRLVRLASRCEVGADLEVFARSPDVVHRELETASPRGLLATATHDTKRGEDTRMRIAVLSERPEAWRRFVTEASERATPYWGTTTPDRTLEYLMWQTFVGAWPITPDRALEYATKAAREARVRTTWREPNAEYEAAVRRWITSVLADVALVTSIAAFVAELEPRARANSLAQLLLKLTAPGVPDLYQGCELADHSLVDPDNRRPVDFEARDRTVALDEIRDDLGLAKLWTIRRVLRLRADRPELFAAPYAALTAHGSSSERVFAFSRGSDLVTVVPRAGAIGGDTLFRLPVGEWRNVLTDREHGGGTLAAAALWAEFPVALLVRR